MNKTFDKNERIQQNENELQNVTKKGGIVSVWFECDCQMLWEMLGVLCVVKFILEIITTINLGGFYVWKLWKSDWIECVWLECLVWWEGCGCMMLVGVVVSYDVNE